MRYQANVKIGRDKDVPRVYLQSRGLANAGFNVGDRYSVTFPDDCCIRLQVTEDGERVVSRRRCKSGGAAPVIHLQNRAMIELLPESAERVQVDAANGVIEIKIHHSDQKALDRVARLKSRLANGDPLLVGDICSGAGIMSNAVDQGLKDAGIDTELAFAIDLDKAMLAQHMKNATNATQDTQFIESGIEHVDPAQLPQVDVLNLSLPCSGASLAGRASLKLRAAEEHFSVGSLFVSALNICSHVSASVIVFENVPAYSTTMSMTVIRSVLTNMGYNLSERVLGRDDGGAFEDRNRMALVAVSQELGEFDFNTLRPSAKRAAVLGDLLDPVPLDSDRYKRLDYIWAKAERDAAKGSGFKPNVFDASSTRVNTITKNYAKITSTNPLVAHPSKKLWRLLTPAEHCRVKGIDPSMIEGMSDTTAHQALGQSVLAPVFRSVGSAVGRMLHVNAFELAAAA